MIRGRFLYFALGCIPACGAGWAQVGVQFCNTFTLGTTATDQHGETFSVQGLSALALLGESPPGVAHFIAAMDNSNKVVFIDVMTDRDGCITAASIVRGLSLSVSMDYEGIASFGGRLILAEEGTPALHEFDPSTGQRLAVYAAPGVFSARRANFGFESLAGDDTLGLWTANEEALTPDGPVSSPTTGTVVRLLRYAPSGGGFVPMEQYAYRCERMHGAAISGGRSGVSDMLLVPRASGDPVLLVLERSFALNLSGLFENRLLTVSFSDATDVRDVPGLIGQVFVPVAKAHVWSGRLNANMEGIALGRSLGFGRRSLVGIVDDGDPISVNMLVGFSLSYSACIADYNEDGGVDGEDVSAFFASWEAGDDAADANEDGGLDGADVQRFFERWESGGCE